MPVLGGAHPDPDHDSDPDPDPKPKPKPKPSPNPNPNPNPTPNQERVMRTISLLPRSEIEDIIKREEVGEYVST